MPGLLAQGDSMPLFTLKLTCAVLDVAPAAAVPVLQRRAPRLAPPPFSFSKSPSFAAVRLRRAHIRADRNHAVRYQGLEEVWGATLKRRAGRKSWAGHVSLRLRARRLGLFERFFDFMSLDHANNNVHNMRLCRLALQHRALSPAAERCAAAQARSPNQASSFTHD